MAKVKTCCFWCGKPITMPEGFSEKKQKPVCSQGCKDAETLFGMMFSDEEINRRAHYRYLTEGNDGEA